MQAGLIQANIGCIVMKMELYDLCEIEVNSQKLQTYNTLTDPFV